MLFYYIGIGGNSIASLFSLACLFICFSGISLAFLFVLLVCYYLLFFLFVWYFNIIARSAFLLLFFSRACFCFLVVMYAIVFAPCSVNAERQKQHSGQRIAERRQGERPPVLSCLPVCLCYRCILFYYARALLAGGYTTARPGYFFGTVYGKKSAKSVLLILITHCSYCKLSLVHKRVRIIHRVSVTNQH